MDFLAIEDPHTGVDVNIWVITDHFMWYAKAAVTSTQMAKVTATAFLELICHKLWFSQKSADRPRP